MALSRELGAENGFVFVVSEASHISAPITDALSRNENPSLFVILRGLQGVDAAVEDNSAGAHLVHRGVVHAGW
jgi:hypothetical protein